MDRRGYVRTPIMPDGRIGEIVCPARTLKATAQGRPHTILHYETAKTFQALGRPCPRIADLQFPPRAIGEFLDEVDDVIGRLAVSGRFRPASQEAHAPETPWIVGYWHFGGKASPVDVGSLVRLTSRKGIFRVLTASKNTLSVMSRDALNPGRTQVPARDVCEHKKQRRPVHSTAGHTFPSLGRTARGPRRGAHSGSTD